MTFLQNGSKPVVSWDKKKSCLGYSAACYRLSFRTKRETLHQCIYARTLKRLISLHCYLIDKKTRIFAKIFLDWVETISEE